MLSILGDGHPGAAETPSGTHHVGPVSDEERAKWQLRCAELMFEDELPFSTFDHVKWKSFLGLIS